uniref:Uncharacterized protein n=2 Tax=Ixodes scapularis TaxID=6945 RepID=A0A1S4LX24_IXOSC
PGRSIQIIKRAGHSSPASSKKPPLTLAPRPDAAIPRLSLSLTAPLHSPSPVAFRVYSRPAVPSSRIFKSGRPPVELSPLNDGPFLPSGKKATMPRAGRIQLLPKEPFSRSSRPSIPSPKAPLRSS